MSDSDYEALVKRLKDKGIKMIATDFDLTLISIHTGGMWMFTPPPLATKVRPGFAAFLCEALKQGMFVAVVTFSPQVDLVKDVLNIAIGEESTSKICIRGHSGDWKPLFKWKEGKLSHIDSAVKFFYKTTKTKIKLPEVLLLDDDTRNIEVAKQSNIYTVQVLDNNSLPDLVKNVDAVLTQ